MSRDDYQRRPGVGDVTGIEWTRHTFNPWVGCARISPGCVNCYADEQTRRWNPGNDQWRRHGTRRVTSDANWRKPYQWNRAAEAVGTPALVFCSSLADVFEDHPALGEPRERLWKVIVDTPWLTWQLLTKRIGSVAQMVPWGRGWPPNVWLGVSVENQRYADERIPVLLESGAKTTFLSCEPLLGPVDLSRYLGAFWRCRECGDVHGQHTGSAHCFRCGARNWPLPVQAVDWVIIGGESGRKARPMQIEWAQSLVAQCQYEYVPAFMKQLGSVAAKRTGAHGKGGNPDEWPADLRVRQFPREAVPAGDAR